jgi:hypothetical protein
MKISVTQHVIDKAQRSGPVTELVRNCLVATAFKEAGLENIVVGVETAAIHREKSGMLPEFVQSRIIDFHRGKAIQPFEFDFEFTHFAENQP